MNYKLQSNSNQRFEGYSPKQIRKEEIKNQKEQEKAKKDLLKSHISKRWWVEYVDDRIISVKNQLIPCSENDFKLSQMGIISDRILKRMKNKFV